MMKRPVYGLFAAVAAALALAALPFAGSAQPVNPVTTPTPAAGQTTTGPSSDVQALFVTCDTGAVMNLSGTLLSGFDVYFQIFNGPSASGEALSAVRQVQADGTFTFSERVAYNNGVTVAPGAFASARVWVARETDSSRIDFEFNVSDVQDGCQDPQSAPSGVTGSTSLEVGGAAASGAPAAGGTAQNLFAPFGLVLNPNLRPEPSVVVGARLSDRFRSETPGLIYAACENFELALPGIVYDTDNVIVYWSWFARTLEQIQQHLDNANYSVRVNRAPFNTVTRTEPELRGGNYYVFYYAEAGNLRPGHYEVEYRLTWDAPINDGFEDFGPGTANPIDAGNCNFDVLRNPEGTSVAYSGLFNPTEFPVHDLFADE
jgi:hypothetical protein